MYTLIIVGLMLTNPFSSNNSDTIAITAIDSFATMAACSRAAASITTGVGGVDKLSVVCVANQ